MSALVVTPTRVPIVSNMSTNRKVKTTTSMSMLSTCEKSNLQKIGDRLGGVEMMPLNLVIPIGIPIRAVAMMPISRAPGTFRMTRMPVRMRPITESRPGPLVRVPRSTSVAGLSTTMPPLFRPISAMNRPMPAPIAFRMDFGKAFTIASRTLVKVRITKMKPSMRTAVRANCQE